MQTDLFGPLLGEVYADSKQVIQTFYQDFVSHDRLVLCYSPQNINVHNVYDILYRKELIMVIDLSSCDPSLFQQVILDHLADLVNYYYPQVVITSDILSSKVICEEKGGSLW